MSQGSIPGFVKMDKHRETLAPCSQSYGTHDQVTDLGMEVRAMGMGYTDEELRTKPEKLQVHSSFLGNWEKTTIINIP